MLDMTQPAHSGTPQKATHHGLWESPISIDIVTGQTIGLDSPRVALNGKIYYLERRPTGKSVIVEIDTNGKTRDVLPENYSARSTVHEYGGGAYTLTGEGKIVFTDGDSKNVYLLDPETTEVKKVLEKQACRYGDFEVHPMVQKWVAAVEEDHTDPAPIDVKNRLVLIDVEAGETSVLVSGRDFYTSPRFSHDGKRICWLEWDHPDMPWSGAELHFAEFDTSSGKVSKSHKIAGTAQGESAFMPSWAPDGKLWYSRDGSGFWQLEYVEANSSNSSPFVLKGLEEADLGEPEWQLAFRSRIILPETTTMITWYCKDGSKRFIAVDLTTGSWKNLDVSISDMRADALVAHSSNSFIVIGGNASTPKALNLVTLKEGKVEVEALKKSVELAGELKEYISKPRLITCPTRPFPDLSDDNKPVTHGVYYPPHNPKFTAPYAELPPLILFAHGGPTGHNPPYLDFNIAYFTSRGYAVLDLNYRGSSGYGRDYIRALNGVWGLAEPADATAMVEHLAGEGLIDKTRAGVRGGSAGGYVTIQAVCDIDDSGKCIWAGGNSLFGISDLSNLYATTHKFESRYFDMLLYGLGKSPPQSEQERILKDRSALTHPDRISAPLLLLQGADDKIVPEAQARDLLEAGKKLGKDIELVVYEGEGHGFRKGDTLRDALLREERWWQKCLLREWVG